MPADLGFTSYGNGPYVFADLRGYGASRGIEGTYTLEESAGDASALRHKLGWTQFSLIGHSMSGLIVQLDQPPLPSRITWSCGAAATFCRGRAEWTRQCWSSLPRRMRFVLDWRIGSVDAALLSQGAPNLA